jgi:hypothetical protein
MCVRVDLVSRRRDKVAIRRCPKVCDESHHEHDTITAARTTIQHTGSKCANAGQTTLLFWLRKEKLSNSNHGRSFGERIISSPPTSHIWIEHTQQ